MKSRMPILCFLLLSTLKVAGQSPDLPVKAFTNVTVIDGTGAQPSDKMTVVIEGNLIKDLFKTGSKKMPSGAELTNLEGHYLLPGLINSHVHLSNYLLGRVKNKHFEDQQELLYAELRRMLYGGVTTIRDMAGDARLLAVVKRSIFLNRIKGPDLYYAALMGGPDFLRNDHRIAPASQGYSPGEAAWQQIVTRETDIEIAVARAAGTHATGLKFYIGIDYDIIQELTEEAHRQGLKAWAHSTVFPDRPIKVVKAGVDVISHLGWVVWQDKDLDPSENTPYTDTPLNNPRPSFNPDLVQAGSPEMIELFEEMKSRNTLLDVTLSAYKSGGGSARGVTPELMTEIARAASHAGVRLTTGTDYFTDINEPFPSVIHEIEYLVDQQVLTPLEAITAATLHGAHAIGIENTHGTIEAGKVANMMILKADPLADIKALREVTLVVKNGQLYPREEYIRRIVE